MNYNYNNDDSKLTDFLEKSNRSPRGWPVHGQQQSFHGTKRPVNCNPIWAMCGVFLHR